jgi:hypothetical protein
VVLPRLLRVIQVVRCCSFPRIWNRQRIGYVFQCCLFEDMLRRVPAAFLVNTSHMAPSFAAYRMSEILGLGWLIIRILSHDR